MSPGRTKHVYNLRWRSIISKLEKSLKIAMYTASVCMWCLGETLLSCLIFSWPALLYFLSIFYLPRCILPDFPSVSSLDSLPFLSCCHRATTCMHIFFFIEGHIVLFILFRVSEANEVPISRHIWVTLTTCIQL